jgi:hypothetical protein
MTDSAELPVEYLEFETRNHAAYGVEPYMYTNLLTAVKDVVRDALGDDWNGDFEAAWDERLAALLARIEALAPSRPLLAAQA